MQESVARREQVKFYGDLQLNWEAVIEPLRRGAYRTSPVGKLSIPGDAPKSFLHIKEYREGRPGAHPRFWQGYIAKVGSKWYPTESITEQLLTRMGQAAGVEIAESQLRVVNGQVRFLSKYFLKSTESLDHGIQIFKRCLDDEFVDQIAKNKQEREFYTFQTVLEAVAHAYPAQASTISTKLVEMLTFDAFIGNNDRHPANWGVIVPISMASDPRFSPVFDTARGLFWNSSEGMVRQMLRNPPSLEAYVRKSRPLISWEGSTKIDHFDLIGHICVDYPEYREAISRFCKPEILVACCGIVQTEFRETLSEDRRQLIVLCLKKRFDSLCDCLN